MASGRMAPRLTALVAAGLVLGVVLMTGAPVRH